MKKRFSIRTIILASSLLRQLSTFFRVSSHRAGFWAALGLITALTFGPRPARATVTEAWVQRYSNLVNSTNDQAFKVVRDAVGDFLVAGTSDDGIGGPALLIIKYAGADGSMLWQQRRYGQVGVSAMTVDSSGNLAVAGAGYTARFAGADGALLWDTSNYGPGGANLASAVATDSSDNIVVTGSSKNGFDDEFTYYDYDCYTIKYAAADGSVLWAQRFNYGEDQGRAVAVDGSGNVVITAFSAGDFYTAKYAGADGTLLWEQRHHRTASPWDFPNAIALDASGNVVVTGSTFDGISTDFYTAKYAAANGALLWERSYNGPTGGADLATAVALDASGNVAVTGVSDATNGKPDFYTAKYAAADGALLWEKRFSGGGDGYDQPTAVAVDGNGNVVVTGSSISASLDFEYYTVQYAAANGALLWDVHGPVGAALAMDASGNVAVTGNYFHPTFLTAKYAAADGAQLWQNHFFTPGNKNDLASAVAVDVAGNVAVTGASDIGNGTSDYYTARYSAATGALLWEKRYDGPANWHDHASAVAVDASGNVVVTGYSTGLNSSLDFYTAKYAAADGTLLWEQRFDGTANFSDMAKAVVVDASGDVIVTGASSVGYDYDGYEYFESYTAKYAAANGALLWGKFTAGAARSVALDASGNVIIAGPATPTTKYAAADGALLWERNADNNVHAAAVAVDSNGNVVIAGTRYDAISSLDFYTAKYAAATGALLWEKSYNGPVNGYDQATAVAVDANGNVIVNGSSQDYSDEFGDDTEIYTAKYAAGDGAALWEKRGPAGDARAVAVDSSGNAVVTGSSFHHDGSRDYYTASYAAADGALLWEKRYNGPAHGDDNVGGHLYADGETSHSLALGPNDMVAITGASDGNFQSNYSIYDYSTVVYRKSPSPAGPEITVEQPIGTDLLAGAASIDCGNIAPGSGRNLVFTIRSEGLATLSAIGIVVDGANASDFPVTVEPANAIAGPNGTSTFTVRFTPASRGTKHAVLHVFSNDGDESPFDIALNGTRPNALPVVSAETANTAFRTAIDLNVLANDSDLDGDLLSIAQASFGEHGTIEIVSTINGPRVRYTPAPGFVGIDRFYYSVGDGFGETAGGLVDVTVGAPPAPVYTMLYDKGAPVPGAGDPATGVPAGATWKTFGVPSLASNGRVALAAKIATPEGTLAVVHLGNSGLEEAAAPLEYLLAKQGDLAPGANGSVFASFKDPLLNNDGTAVILATVGGGSAGANGGIWKHYDEQGLQPPTLVALAGAQPTGVSPGARWKAFTSVALSDGSAGDEMIAFTATMSGNVGDANDTGLWIAQETGITLALREGATVSIGAISKKVRTLVALQAVVGAGGQGHGATAVGVLVRVKFQDATEGVLRVSMEPAGLQISVVALTGDPIGELALATFSMPTQSSNGLAAFIGTVTGGEPGFGPVIFQSNGPGLDLLDWKGEQPNDGNGAYIGAFSSLVNDSAGRVAFTARLKGFGVRDGNNNAICLHDSAALRLIAREGAQPPGVPEGAKWAGFPSLALPDGATGPIFIGKLLIPAPGQPNPARITAANNLGVWIVDPTGAVQLIARTGDAFDAQRKITAFTLLSAVRSSPTQTRSFTEVGDIIYRVTLSDGSQHVIVVRLP